jgi:uncharacterized membrane protein
MQINDYRILFISIALIGILLFASPTIALLIKPPTNQEFSSLYLLGPNHTFDDIPSNIEVGTANLVYLGIINHMGSSEYYTCSLKLGNSSAPLPNATLGLPSSMPTLYEYKSIIKDTATFEVPLTFQVDQLTITNDMSYLSIININGVNYPANLTSAWDANQNGYYYNLIVELAIYNSQTGTIQYNNRYLSLILNVTE